MFARITRGLLAIAFVLGMGATLSACNTFEGMGRDISAAGDAITGNNSKE